MKYRGTVPLPVGAQRRNYQVTAYLERDEFLRFKQLASDAGRTHSQAARDLIVAGLPAKTPTT